MIAYNERTWAIDLIVEINKWAGSRSVLIKRAGGENSLKGGGSIYFPDVILFSDDDGTRILQGWELKFPDTDLDDDQFIQNAYEKAKLLRLNSFLLWNVTYAKLYVITEQGEIKCEKTWADLSHIRKRNQVQPSRNDWIDLLHTILSELLSYFNNGIINSQRAIDSITGEGISQLILENQSEVAEELKNISSRNKNLRDSIIDWWHSSHLEYQKKVDDKDAMWSNKARIVLVSWLNRILFAHTLKKFINEFNIIDKDEFNLSAEKALNFISNLTKKYDFWNIFQPQAEDISVKGSSWNSLVELNRFLKDLEIYQMDQSEITEMFKLIVERGKRKVAGQFTTPKELADLMAALGMEDFTLNFIDPCCGTGTIARAVYDLKEYYTKDRSLALSSVYASDKFAFPLQLATLSLTDPNNMKSLIRVFKEDASSLTKGKIIKLMDPITGEPNSLKLPSINYVISNLPFVQQEDIKIMNPGITAINDYLSQFSPDGKGLSGKSDLYAYLIFYLGKLIETDGIITVNISNSWLSSKWGDIFKKLILRIFKIEYVITSGNGTWFKEPKVVTNIANRIRHLSEIIVSTTPRFPY